jgi:pimeloyl-ACP methyl ester carboxylesterase
MRRGGVLIAGVLLTAFLPAILASGGAEAAMASRTQAVPRPSSYGQVYLMRGLMGPVLSTGVDSLAARLRQHGIEAPVHGHGSYGTLADEALSRYRAGNHGPIVIIGHSLGAYAAIEMAKTLQASRVPVSLIVTFGLSSDVKAPANVSSVVNYYQSQSFSSGRVLPAPGFHGAIGNVDLQKSAEVNHVNMVQIGRLQAQIIARVMALVGAHPPASASAASAAPAPAPSEVSSTAAPAPSATSGAN